MHAYSYWGPRFILSLYVLFINKQNGMTIKWPNQRMDLYIYIFLYRNLQRERLPIAYKGRGPGVVVKGACLGSRRSRVCAPLWPSSFKETNVSCPLTRKDSILWGASVTERQRARPQTARARISNQVSGGQCHLIHLTIFKRFSWLNLAYMCTKVA